MSEGPTGSPTPPPEATQTAYRYRGGGICPCARCRCRGLTWPVILITLGALFLIPQFVHRVDFGDLWPILLIVIGVMKLVEFSASTEGHRG